MEQEHRKTFSRTGHGRFRWATQAVTFGFFLFLFAKATYPYTNTLPHSLFQKIDPLIAFAAGIGAQRWLIVALFTIALTILAGRVFCSYLCPLGFLIDLADVKLAKKHAAPTSLAKPANRGDIPSQGGRRKALPHRLREIKYWILGALVAGIVFGSASLLILDPLAFVTRVLTVVFYPLWIAATNLALGLIQPLAERMGWLKLAYLSYPQPAFQTALGNFVLFGMLLLLGVISTRFWCRHLCPLGALLGFFSRASIIRRRVHQQCIECGRCKEICPMDAVGEDPRTTALSECISCEACQRICPVSAIVFSAGRQSLADHRLQAGLSRRGFLGGLGLGICTTALTRLDPGVIKASPRLIRPPGAIPEPEFLTACTRCGLCVRSCITHTLQPAGWERGLIRWETPLHVMRVAGCEQQCNMCGQVCPTGAIRNLSLSERQHAKVGTAVIYQSRCVAWRHDQLCLLCDESCPYNAIVFRTIEGHKRPFVDESRCNGCGMCESVCPVEGEAAIVVHQDGEVRIRRGSYEEILRERRILLKPKQDML